MEETNYTELDWRWAIVLGAGSRVVASRASSSCQAGVTHLVFARNPG